MKKNLIVAACLLLALLAGLKWLGKAPAKPEVAESSALYTGKEPKRKVKLFYPNYEKPGMGSATAEIFATQSQAAQAKQLLGLLMAKPAAEGLAPAFPEGSRWREVFFDEGSKTCVVDLDAGIGAALEGGTSSEFATVYSLVRSLCDNFKQAAKVQILVNGEIAETLAGHVDISRPLSLSDF